MFKVKKFYSKWDLEYKDSDIDDAVYNVYSVKENKDGDIKFLLSAVGDSYTYWFWEDADKYYPID